MKNDAVKISIESGEGTLVSNQDGIEFVHSEFIRDQMVKLNPYAFALSEWFPSILKEPLSASDTLSEATAPVSAISLI